MSSSVENDSGAEEETINGDVLVPAAEEPPTNHKGNGNGSHPAGGRIVELLQEERDGASTPEQLGTGTNRYKAVQQLDNESEDGSSEALPRRAGSPIESILSNPDDSPSVQVNITATLSDSSKLYHRALLCLLRQEAACFPPWRRGQVSKARVPHFDPLTVVFNRASQAPHILYPAPLHLPFPEATHGKPLSVAK
jgi:hypothetical protein